ncbi:PTS lactose/cellobiose transporter subunit IIA [Olsenella sp. SW781]|uniref:PTS lactose/cellobiose transporter subunit IIA n=1 Tax=Olsenella sp. SW781 TaxID=2530046 RepID=UPI00143C5C02|nr:PTS lactose/cellobiose transporter subunit IIA [Olsenella sp. SW781]NJE80968.1 PTS lactose/cellobiose transporter subunit IIA [Olsenella sp. SW781]
MIREEDEMVSAAFEIIVEVGNARSCYIDAIKAAHDGDYEQANELIETARKAFSNGHKAHTGLIQAEARGENTSMNLILTHAEDQLMSAEAFGILADAFIDVYRRIDQVEGGTR